MTIAPFVNVCEHDCVWMGSFGDGIGGRAFCDILDVELAV